MDARDFLWFGVSLLSFALGLYLKSYRLGRAALTVGLWIWFLLSVGLAALAPLLNLSRLVNVTILAVALVSALATGWCLRYLGWAVLSAALWTWLVVGVGVTTLSILLDPYYSQLAGIAIGYALVAACFIWKHYRGDRPERSVPDIPPCQCTCPRIDTPRAGCLCACHGSAP